MAAVDSLEICNGSTSRKTLYQLFYSRQRALKCLTSRQKIKQSLSELAHPLLLIHHQSAEL